MPRSSAHCCYTNTWSVGGDSKNDMDLGYQHGVVGCNLPSFGKGHIIPGTLLLVHDKSHIHISEARGDAEEHEKPLWHNNGGARWKYNYKIRSLTPVVPLTPALREFVRNLGVDERAFWDNIRHSSQFRDVLLKLADHINQS